MIELHIEKASINPVALDADLKVALGEMLFGVSASRGVVTVHLADKATRPQQAQAEAIVLAHDPAVLTPDQQADRDRDATPLFTLEPDEAETWADVQDAGAFRRAVARAVVQLREIVRGA